MNNEMFARLKGMSLEIQALVRQGVREGISERIDERNTLLQQWFTEMTALIDITNEQQLFLEDMLQQEQQLLQQLEQEQKDLALDMNGRKKLTQYQNIAGNH